MNYLSRDEYDRLSIASKDLVKAAGGAARACEIAGYKQLPQIQRCCTIVGNDRRFFTIKAVAELEADAVESGHVPPVTKVLADLAGFDLVRRERCKGDTSALMGQADLANAYAKASASLSMAYADFELTEEEKAECLKNFEALQDCVARLIANVREQKTTEKDG